MNYDDLFNKINSTSGRNDKIAILHLHKDDTILQNIIELALSPDIQFYIKKIPRYELLYLQHHTISWALEELNQLTSRAITGNKAIDHLGYILSSIAPTDAKVIERIINKDLACGVAASTVNKVWKGFIKEFPCMLCSAYNEKLINRIKFPAFAQVKQDGLRFVAIIKDSIVDLRTRNGKPIYLHGNLEKEFLALSYGNDMVFDGELLVWDATNNKYFDRKTGNGIINKAIKGTISKEEASNVRCELWDIMEYTGFHTGKYDVPYDLRYNLLIGAVSGKPSAKIRVVDTEIVKSVEEAREYFEGCLARGLEGIILKDPEGIWESKRSLKQIKFKAELECDLEVIAVQEGTGKYAGMLGALLCASADKSILVSVGTGFSDRDRVVLWAADLVGSIAAIKYNARITSKQNTEDSLFLPVFVEIRSDKTTADSSQDIE